MATSRMAPDADTTLLARMSEARARTDSLFRLLPPNSFYERPIPERHRLIFYLGHLEAFDWNLLASTLGLASRHTEFDKLFAFGIDPVGTGLPTDVASDWPDIARVEGYMRGVREALDSGLRTSAKSTESAARRTLLNVAIEHRLMHAETLAYLLHALPVERKTPQPRPSADARPSPQQRSIAISAGRATLGQARSDSGFGWDNEFEENEVSVPAFAIDAFPVTNGRFLKFVQAGGYEDEGCWSPADWEWKQREGIEHPHFWSRRSGSSAADPDAQWEYRAMFGAIPLPHSWPVYVSHAEATAFANWSRKKLPTEAQWHRAGYGTPAGSERLQPWGDEPADATRGNFHFQRWDACPVDAHPAGASAFGAHDLVGNGWEWTSSYFSPFPGFEPFSFYPGYSANFFDNKHYLMKGGSPQTDACMARRSFRNWFQPHYPYVYAKFRCVEE
ncbi:MAG TPA: SUMF1/EgtB/PvdO family nonheme iron enzyme [Candidatus Limnocylindrales bacterium]|nr:SUMF1/EgtB/PvdO family nonheme iron enzyme [Candidatus Limnocylindrales bacterium]